MATFVLVQPAWMGGWCWNKMAAQLREAGHHGYAPTLTERTAALATFRWPARA